MRPGTLRLKPFAAESDYCFPMKALSSQSRGGHSAGRRAYTATALSANWLSSPAEMQKQVRLRSTIKNKLHCVISCKQEHPAGDKLVPTQH